MDRGSILIRQYSSPHCRVETRVLIPGSQETTLRALQHCLRLPYCRQATFHASCQSRGQKISQSSDLVMLWARENSTAAAAANKHLRIAASTSRYQDRDCLTVFRFMLHVVLDDTPGLPLYCLHFGRTPPRGGNFAVRQGNNRRTTGSDSVRYRSQFIGQEANSVLGNGLFLLNGPEQLFPRRLGETTQLIGIKGSVSVNERTERISKPRRRRDRVAVGGRGGSG